MPRGKWVVVSAVVGLTGCGGAAPPESSPSPSVSAAVSAEPSANAGPLGILDLVPADTADVTYTDWSGIRAAAGLGGSGEQVRDELFLALLDKHTAQSWFAGPERNTHYEAWGFDAADSDWEFTAAMPDGSLVHVVALSETTDWDGLVARFDERGYTSESRGDVVLRSAERDLFIDWQAASDSAMLNVALIESRRRLVMADAMPEVIEVVDVMQEVAPSLAENETVSSNASKLEGTLSGSLRIGRDRCLGGGFGALDPEVVAEFLAGLRRYEVLGAGYFIDGGAARVRGVMTFPDSTIAAEDMTSRAGLAEAWGSSLGIFTLVSAEVVDRHVVLELDVADGPGTALDDMGGNGAYTSCL